MHAAVEAPVGTPQGYAFAVVAKPCLGGSGAEDLQEIGDGLNDAMVAMPRTSSLTKKHTTGWLLHFLYIREAGMTRTLDDCKRFLYEDIIDLYKQSASE